MEFKIGNCLELGTKNSKYYIESPVDGLDIPEIRTGEGYYSGVDGGFVSSQLYGFRRIIIKGFYIGDTCEEADELRLNLLNSLKIRCLYPVLITTFSRKFYFVEGYVTGIKCAITNPKFGQYQITLLCPDPLIYDGGDGKDKDSAWFEQKFYKEKPGGFIIKYKSPVDWSPGQMATSIDNFGVVKVFPIITLRGKYKNPRIRNLTNGSLVKINRTTTASDTITIDMKNRIINLNGVSIASNRTVDSTWWGLEPGTNMILLETDSTSDADVGFIKWKNGYQSI